MPKKDKFISIEISTKRIVVIIFMFLVVLACALIIKDEILWNLGYYDDYFVEEIGYDTYDDYDQDCNVNWIPIRGDIVTYSTGVTDINGDPILETTSEEVVYFIEEAEKNNSIYAILLEIDSTGGYPAAAEEIVRALNRSSKPTIAYIREFGLSAAYWVASAADKIYALDNSDIGSIGVTLSYLDNSERNELEGFTYNQLSTGKFKDTLDPNKSLTEEEKELLLRDLKVVHDNFVKSVAENRNIDISKVEKLADGSSMLGQMALDSGLIDEIGDLNTAEKFLENSIKQEVKICW